jgi:germination protein M
MNARSRTSQFPILLLLLVTAAACMPGVGSAGPIGSRSPDLTPSPSDSPVSPQPSATPAGSATPGPTQEPSQPAETMDLTVYFFLDDVSGRGPFLVPVRRTVPRTVGVARAALGELIRGPSAAERDAQPGMSTTVPADTILLGIDIQDGLATVDLSREFERGGGTASMTGRLAQVVYTVTQFPTVDRVAFRLDGEPVRVFSGEGIILDRPSTRDQYTSLLPPIFVDRPAWGGSSGNPMRVQGVANVFEATLFLELYDRDGGLLARQLVTATCGTGCWGTFDVQLSYSIREAQQGTLVAFTHSAQDGSRVDVRSHPVQLAP